MYQCGNCGRTIGALETPYQWQGHIVCPECVTRLSRTPVPPAPTTPLDQLAAASRAGPISYGRPHRYQDKLMWVRVLMLALGLSLSILGGETAILGYIILAGWLAMLIYRWIDKSRAG